MDALHAVAEPRRREILRLVWDAERSAGDVAAHFDVTFGAVSQHLAVLRKAGLVSVRKDGNRRLYRADRAALGPLAAWLESMWSAELDTLAALAEQVERDNAEQEGRSA
ncbi:ArsR/SmtB family transcription factor [Kutzneria kofuensis]|uniref:DNA-binding transcriptional ArsR family regulator n=1 Tax=Kutzneria kofuensis TaxID=103725 RepID=A0A7W9KIY1_9PSEU|nr:metalloregulator ArsR/SmtB family transcription factor [Kutzneria kofuensis]MBB5893133.1 DNA-binding transcriptional ArsR family regulator [Kutzneria kofuensis]